MDPTWTPRNLTTVCAQETAHLTACSPAAFLYLAIVTNLYGRTTISLPNRNPNSYITRPPIVSGREVYSEDNSGAASLSYDNYNNLDQSICPDAYSQTSSSGSSLDVKESKSSHYANIDYNSDVVDSQSAKQGSNTGSSEEYDFIIVGAGSAGNVVANRLSEIKKWKILLLEAGPDEPDITSVPSLAPIIGRSSIDWGFKTQPEKQNCRAYVGHSCAWTRGKCLGGSSAANYLVYLRGHRLDYDAWSAMGNPGWSFDEVLPYFKKAENNRDIEAKDTTYHGVGGPLNVGRYPFTDINTILLVQALNESGLPIKDLNDGDNYGTEIAQSTSIDGRRWSTNMAYIRPIRCVRENFHIVINAYVTKVIIDPTTKVAQGVTYVKDGETYDVYAKKEVIVSAGTVNSPKILMLSGVGPKEHLNNMNIPVLADLDVGKNLQDHAATTALILGLSNKTSTLVTVPSLIDEVKKYFKEPLDHKTGPLTTTSTFNSVGFIKTSLSRVNAPDIQFQFVGRSTKDFYADPANDAQLHIFPFSFYDSLSVWSILLTPESTGEILLNNTDPVFGPPLIYPGYFKLQYDVDRLIEGMQYAVKLEETETFKQYGISYIRTRVKGCEEYVWGSYDYFYCILVQYTVTIYHPAGTCKMGPAWDKTAVLDSRLRVHGIKNLRVIDASIMPNIVRCNTNAPTIMIGERASDFVKEDYNI